MCLLHKQEKQRVRRQKHNLKALVCERPLLNEKDRFYSLVDFSVLSVRQF